MKNRILFVVRHRESYWGGTDLSSGLKNSVRLLVDMLVSIGIEAKMVDVVDNNSIDREVTQYQPTHVIIEALWVVPSKLPILQKLHPSVRWIVRLHSNLPFLANEGIAMEWIAGYLANGVELMANNERATADMRVIAAAGGYSDRLVTYGPNYYPVGPFIMPKLRGQTIDIGCFGAIRPLKNQLSQAVAALGFAAHLRLPLRFHINEPRVENAGEPVIRNLKALLGDRLVTHSWLSHDDFLTLLRQMDISLQVSLTETFNIVTADAVSQSVPVVTSSEVEWLHSYAHADPTNTRSISNALLDAWQAWPHYRAHRQRRNLASAAHASERVWEERFGG